VCNNTSILIGGKDFYLNDRVAEIIDSHSPDVLVLNRGAHYVPDWKLLNDLRTNIFPTLEDWQAKCNLNKNKNKKGGDDCLLIWRTTVPGHPDCMAYQEPMQSVEKMEEIIAANNNSNYHWHDFSHQNELVLNAFQQQTNLTYQVMDTYSINILRPDLHLTKTDCLHTCMPDDLTSSWLFHHMLQLKYSNHTKGQFLDKK